MGKLSREKGKRGEREVVKLTRERWHAADPRRTAQVDGTLSADVIGALRTTDGGDYHVEVKRVAKLPAITQGYLNQIETDRDGKPWVLFVRADGGKWLLVMDAERSTEFAMDLNEQVFLGGG